MSYRKKISSRAKTALITGAAKGIGRATALRLARDGFNVVVNYKNSAKEALALSKLLARRGKTHLVVRADITNEKETKEMITKTIEKFGSLDVLVNNAAVNQTQPLSGLVIKNFDKILGTNLRGAILLTRLSLPFLKKAKSPRIIFITSETVFRGSQHRIAYVVSKGGLVGLTRALALELAPKKILVNAVVPDCIASDMFLKFSVEPIKKRIQGIPLRRLGKPDEVAAVIAFLASNDSSFITGQCIHVNGGTFLA